MSITNVETEVYGHAEDSEDGSDHRGTDGSAGGAEEVRRQNPKEAEAQVECGEGRVAAEAGEPQAAEADPVEVADGGTAGDPTRD